MLKIILLETKQQLWETYKKGIIQQIFSQKIRFKNENGENYPDWEFKPLKDLIKIEHGYAFSGKYFTDKPTEYILLTPGNFSLRGGLNFTKSNTKYYSGTFPNKFILKKGDLLVVMTDLTKEMAILGNTVVLNSDIDVLHNQRIGKIIVNDSEQIFDKYIYILMNTGYCKNEIKRTATGSTVRHTSPKRIYNASIPICNYKEQLKIVNFLSNIDKKIQHLNGELEMQYRFKKGLLQQMFC